MVARPVGSADAYLIILGSDGFEVKRAPREVHLKGVIVNRTGRLRTRVNRNRSWVYASDASVARVRHFGTKAAKCGGPIRATEVNAKP